MEDKILKELRSIKKELQDIRSILDPKTVQIIAPEDIIKKLIQGRKSIQDADIENCTFRKKAISEGIGDCGLDDGKCIGYANDGEEPHDTCKECKVSVNWSDE